MDRRTKFRQNHHPLYLPLYDKLCGLLPAIWQPYQGYRTFSQQDALYAEGRSSPGHVVTNARGGESAHCYGCASDWTIWDGDGQPIWLEASDPMWEIYFDAIGKCGLKPGHAFGDTDHNELNLKCSWVDVRQVYESSGMDNAMALINRMVIA